MVITLPDTRWALIPTLLLLLLLPVRTFTDVLTVVSWFPSCDPVDSVRYQPELQARG